MRFRTYFLHNKLKKKLIFFFFYFFKIIYIKVIKDACATYALLAVLLNNNNIDIGSDLTEFKNFTKELNSELKGYSLSNSDKVRNVMFILK